MSCGVTILSILADGRERFEAKIVTLLASRVIVPHMNTSDVEQTRNGKVLFCDKGRVAEDEPFEQGIRVT